MLTRKKIPLDTRNLMVQLREERKSFREIANMVKIIRAAVQSIIKNFNLRGTTSNKLRSGCPTKLNTRDVRTIIRKVQNNLKINASKLTQHIVEATGKNCYSESVKRILRKAGFHGREGNRLYPE